MPDFDSLFSSADAIPGWLTRDQARELHDRVLDLRPGATVLEVGSHQGRSTVVLAGARTDVRVIAVDPFPADWRYGSSDTRARFESHLRAAGVRDRVHLAAVESGALRGGWSRRIDLVYVDGKHDVRTAGDDLRWGDRLAPGGILLLHDAFSSVGVTLAVLLRVLPSRTLCYRGRVGSLAVLERGRAAPTDRLRILAQLPWFARNVVVKVLLRLRLRRAARLLGHADAADPY